MMGADTLTGNDICNSGSKDWGDIEVYMIDRATGFIADAVLSFGGRLGMVDKLYAVPCRTLILDTDNKRFTLNVPKGRLTDATGFDKNNWPLMADKAWASGVHSFYRTSYKAIRYLPH